ncbi:hypothetical protein CCACVL1_28722 [Corchorus capsularis]|uniref:Uncharacterized protein n=1 Tax=Corchorus capsularis TaxID=210143 RepID=A0A1R3G5L7_COCAP|nr:hypothetical protein CCACVL1_28722 [Corchorus capsularis]
MGRKVAGNFSKMLPTDSTSLVFVYFML